MMLRNLGYGIDHTHTGRKWIVDLNLINVSWMRG